MHLRSLLWAAQFVAVFLLLGSGHIWWALIVATVSVTALWTWDFFEARPDRRHEAPPTEPESTP
jgi:hypothetical protein